MLGTHRATNSADAALAEAFKDRGRAYARKGDYGRTIEDFDHALKIKPNYEDAFIARGSAYMLKQDYNRFVHGCLSSRERTGAVGSGQKRTRVHRRNLGEGFYDRRVRAAEDYYNFKQYIRQNPVKQ